MKKFFTKLAYSVISIKVVIWATSGLMLWFGKMESWQFLAVSICLMFARTLSKKEVMIEAIKGASSAISGKKNEN